MINDLNDLNLSRATPKKTATTVVEESQQIPLEAFDEIAFDEMNIVETPFTTLTTKSTKAKTMALSRSGHVKLATTEGNYLPSALAEQGILALMWLTKDQNGLRSPVVQFELRDLVCRYMYPGREYRPSKTTLAAVEGQLRRVAHTRIVTDRWYDRELGRHVPMDASIIDYIKVVEEGGRNRPRLLEIGWGKQFYKSMTANYTKALDSKVYFQISRPLERRLYRWLDRQLSKKVLQRVPSILDFARYKLAMTHAHIDRGGRTGSNYVRKRLERAIKSLDDKGFSVRMVVDTSSDDFSLEFHRLGDRGPNEVVREDQAGDLVRLFYETAHGSASKRNKKISARDREGAQLWLLEYGNEQARWMVEHAIQLQKKQRAPRILTYAGLSRYEAVAAADYDRIQLEEKGQLDLAFQEQRKALYQHYREALIAKIDESLSAEELLALEQKAHRLIDDEPDVPGFAQKAMVVSALRRLKLEKGRAIAEAAFADYSSNAELRAALSAHHGYDPFEPQ